MNRIQKIAHIKRILKPSKPQRILVISENEEAFGTYQVKANNYGIDNKKKYLLAELDTIAAEENFLIINIIRQANL